MSSPLLKRNVNCSLLLTTLLLAKLTFWIWSHYVRFEMFFQRAVVKKGGGMKLRGGGHRREGWVWERRRKLCMWRKIHAHENAALMCKLFSLSSALFVWFSTYCTNTVGCCAEHGWTLARTFHWETGKLLVFFFLFWPAFPCKVSIRTYQRCVARSLTTFGGILKHIIKIAFAVFTNEKNHFNNRMCTKLSNISSNVLFTIVS